MPSNGCLNYNRVGFILERVMNLPLQSVVGIKSIE